MEKINKNMSKIIFVLLIMVVSISFISAHAESWTFADEVHFDLPDSFQYQGVDDNGFHRFVSLFPSTGLIVLRVHQNAPETVSRRILDLLETGEY